MTTFLCAAVHPRSAAIMLWPPPAAARLAEPRAAMLGLAALRLNHVTAPATDLAASIAFYERLGLKLIVRADHYARFELPDGDATFSLELAPEVARQFAPVIYFECDVDAEHARLARAGVEFKSVPETKSWLWREAHLRDPAGN